MEIKHEEVLSAASIPLPASNMEVQGKCLHKFMKVFTQSCMKRCINQ